MTPPPEFEDDDSAAWLEVLAVPVAWQRFCALAWDPDMLCGYVPCTEHALRSAPIHRRHGLFPYGGTIAKTDYERLLANLAADADAMLLTLSPGEFLGLEIARHGAVAVPQAEGSQLENWQLLEQLARFKIEQARTAKRQAEWANIREVYRTLRRRHHGHTQLQHRRVAGLALH